MYGAFNSRIKLRVILRKMPEVNNAMTRVKTAPTPLTVFSAVPLQPQPMLPFRPYA